jgi:DNA-binding transcriptional MerR regulator
MRTVAEAPGGMFTITDAARYTRLPKGRIRFWCATWGAGLVDPVVNPGTRGGTKMLSQRDLVKIALIPKLLALGLHHDVIRKLFQNIRADFWDLLEGMDSKVLEWVVIVWPWSQPPRPYVMRSAYKHGPTVSPAPQAMRGLLRILDEALFSGAMRGFNVIEVSNLKRELMERLG